MGKGLCLSEKNLGVRPLCSVCVANYNGATYLKQCIDSILAQEYFPGSIEVIVHDDASKDGSVAFIQSRYPQVRLLSSTENVGFCISNNRMVEAAQGTFILGALNDSHQSLQGLREYVSGIDPDLATYFVLTPLLITKNWIYMNKPFPEL